MVVFSETDHKLLFLAVLEIYDCSMYIPDMDTDFHYNMANDWWLVAGGR